MSKYAVMPITDYSQICDAIRENTSGDGPIKSGDIPEKITEIYAYAHDTGYDTGYGEGHQDGHELGIKEGKQAEYDAFWDCYQRNGAAEEQSYLFSGAAWNADTFKPKYDIRPTRGVGIFRAFNNYYTAEGSAPKVDLKELLDNCGVVMDLSKCTSLEDGFNYARITRVGRIDLTSTTDSNTRLFNGSTVEIIEEFVVNENTRYNLCFNASGQLVHIIIVGTIGQNGFDVSSCTKLDHESLMSILTALKDFSGTGETRSITFGSTNLAKLTDAEKAIATQKGWTLL